MATERRGQQCTNYRFFPMAVGYERCLWPQKGGNSSVLNTVFPHGSGVFEGVCGHREEGTAMY